MGAGEIGGVLKKAMADTNLSVKLLALGIISKIAAGMGQPFDKHTRSLTAAVASVCADQKVTTRSAAITALAAMADATGGLESMYIGLASSLESSNPALRASVLGWIVERFQIAEPPSTADLSPLAGPVISCLEDRNGDVRKGAGAVLPYIVANAGFDFIMDQTSNLKPASKATIIPLINSARASGPSASAGPIKIAAASTAGPSKMVKPPAGKISAPNSPARAPIATAKSTATTARSLAMKSLSSVPTSRPASSLSQASQGDDRPTALPRARTANAARPALAGSHGPLAGTSKPSSSSSRVAPFITSSPDARIARLKRDATRWILDAASKGNLFEYLAAQMESHTSPEALSLLFSKDHRAEEDFMAGLTIISEFFVGDAASLFGMPEEEIQAAQLANVDLALKYSALKLLSNNTQLANRCLEVFSHVVETFSKYNERFSDAEAKLFVPALIVKVCHRIVALSVPNRLTARI